MAECYLHVFLLSKEFNFAMEYYPSSQATWFEMNTTIHRHTEIKL